MTHAGTGGTAAVPGIIRGGRVAVVSGGRVAVVPGGRVAVVPGGRVAAAVTGRVAVAPGGPVAAATIGRVAVVPGGRVAAAVTGRVATPGGQAVCRPLGLLPPQDRSPGCLGREQIPVQVDFQFQDFGEQIPVQIDFQFLDFGGAAVQVLVWLSFQEYLEGAGWKGRGLTKYPAVVEI